MKKLVVLILIVLSLVAMSSCSVKSASSHHNHEDVNESEADLDIYTSIESFEAALSSSSTAHVSISNNGEQDSTMTTYFSPTGIPCGYELGKILSGAADVAFYYYPSAAIGSDTDMRECEATQNCFEFRFRRWDLENPLEGIMQQMDQTESNLIDDKYLYDESVKTYYWAENGDVLSIKIPDAYIASSIPLETLCVTDVITVE